MPIYLVNGALVRAPDPVAALEAYRAAKGLHGVELSLVTDNDELICAPAVTRPSTPRRGRGPKRPAVLGRAVVKIKPESAPDAPEAEGAGIVFPWSRGSGE